MAGEINFGLLRTPDFSQALMGGFEEGRARGNQVRADSALAQYQANPDDGVNMNALLAADPVRGTAIVRARQQAQEAEQAARARQAYGAAAQASGMPPELAQLALDDPDGAMKLWDFRTKATTQQIDAAKKQNDVLVDLVGTVVDEGSYQQALQQAQRMGLDVSTLPQQYDPQFIDRTRRQALGVRGVLDWQDREQDNARADAVFANTRNQQNIDNGYQAANLQVARYNAGNASAGGMTPKEARRTQMQLRKEFDSLPEVKAFKDVGPVYAAVRRAPDTPAGDIQIAYTVGKILDPGSVVREGELALVAKAGSPMERILGTGRFVAGNGARMTPAMRKQLLEMLNERVGSMRQGYNAARTNYTGYAQESGIDGRSVVGTDVAETYRDRTAKPAASGAPKVGAIVKGYRYKGGNPAVPASWVKQ